MGWERNGGEPKKEAIFGQKEILVKIVLLCNEGRKENL